MRMRPLAIPFLTMVISCSSASLQRPTDSADGGEDAPTSVDVGSDAPVASDASAADGSDAGSNAPGATDANAGDASDGGSDAPGATDANAGDASLDSGVTPTCDYGAIVEGSLRAADGTVVETSVAAATVKVASIDSCSTVSCASPTTPAATRIVLTSTDQKTWTLFLGLPSFPADLLRLGDTLTLDLTAAVDSTFYKTVDQTIALSHGDKLVLFVASLSNFGEPRLPDSQQVRHPADRRRGRL